MFDREVQWEPTVHSRRMCLRIDGVEDVLVKFGSEIAGETVDFGLGCLHRERVLGETSERGRLILLEIGVALIVWVRNVAEGEDLLSFLSARIRSIIDPNHVWQLERVLLLAQGYSSTDALLGVEHNFVPEDLTRQR